LILGSSGLLGKNLQKYFLENNVKFVTQSYMNDSDVKCDLRLEENVIELLKKMKPDVIINLIAQTDIGKCEIDIMSAFELNVLVVKNITNAICKENPNIKLVQLSTDHLYDEIGYSQENKVIIKNNYAMTKYAGELAAINTKNLIIRTNFFGKSLLKNRQSITDWAFDNAINNNIINGYSDIFFNPLSMATLSKLIFVCIENNLSGIYNLGSRSGLSKAQFLQKFHEYLNKKNKLVIPVEYASFSESDITRPKNMLMNIKKIEKDINLRLPTLNEEIKQVAKEYVE
jgi:dTDP-4-dehydrorhamnose reductase